MNEIPRQDDPLDVEEMDVMETIRTQAGETEWIGHPSRPTFEAADSHDNNTPPPNVPNPETGDRIGP